MNEKNKYTGEVHNKYYYKMDISCSCTGALQEFLDPLGNFSAEFLPQWRNTEN